MMDDGTDDDEGCDAGERTNERGTIHFTGSLRVSHKGGRIEVPCHVFTRSATVI